MAKELHLLSNGAYILQETEKEKKFSLSRKDGEELTESREVMEVYSLYLLKKMLNVEKGDINFDSQISADGKKIKITICSIRR